MNRQAIEKGRGETYKSIVRMTSNESQPMGGHEFLLCLKTVWLWLKAESYTKPNQQSKSEIDDANRFKQGRFLDYIEHLHTPHTNSISNKHIDIHIEILCEIHCDSHNFMPAKRVHTKYTEKQ